MLILASTSRYRRELLTRAGVVFEAVSPTVDEEALKDDRPAQELAPFLARAKAESIARTRPDDIVIGCDQIALHRGVQLGQPRSREGAIAQLTSLAGDSHHLVTAMIVMRGAEAYEHLETPKLTMRALSHDQIVRYVEADEPIWSCGSYRLESRGITLFEKIETSDHSTVVGLPLLALVRILARFGVELP